MLSRFKQSIFSKYFIGSILFLIFAFTESYSQSIAISGITGGVAPSPLTGGTANQAILGVQFAKSGGGATTVDGLTFSLTSSPADKFLNPRLFESANNTFEGIGNEVFIANGTFIGNTIVFTPLSLSFSAGNETKFYFLVIDVDPDVPPAATAIQPSLTNANVSSPATVSGSASGTSYSFTPLTTTIASLNAPTNNVAQSPLVASASGRAVFGFSLTSNGSQTVNGISIQFSNTPIGKISGYSLIPSADADFNTPNGTAIGGLTFTPSATQVVISGLSEAITSTTKNYFLVVNVDAGVDGDTETLQASLTNTNISTVTGVVSGSASGVTYSFAGLTTTFAQLSGGIAPSPLASNATENAILGFSVVSNGNPSLTAVSINLTSTAVGKFTDIKLYESANSTFGGDAEIVDPGGYTVSTTNTAPFQIQFTNLAQTLSSTTRNYFVVVNISPTVNASTPTIQPSITGSTLSLSGSGTVVVTGTTITGTDYSFVDNSPPLVLTFTPPNNQTNVSVKLNQAVITFNEKVNLIGTGTDNDNTIRIRNVTDNLLHETIDPTLPGLVTISGAGNDVVTIVLTNPFTANKQYAIQIGNSVFEDDSNNKYAGISNNTTWAFTIENIPAITNTGGISPLTTCIGEEITITGQRFAGTGNPSAGSSKPDVTIGGQLVPPANITSFNATTIVLTIPGNALTGKVTVKNNDSELTSAESNETLTVKPAINTALSTSTNISPAVNTNFNILVGGVTQTGVSYRVQRPNLTFTASQNGNGAQLSFGPFSHNAPGTYTYRVEASSSGCSTVFLADVVVVIAELTADAGSDRSICDGESTILGGNPPGFGGTGFISYSWTSDPAGFSSTSPNPTVSPSVGTTYTLVVTDNTGASANSSVIISVNPTPVVSFEPTPPDVTLRTSFSLENKFYELNASPTQLISEGATFSGPGVVSISEENKYYFNPQLAGVSNTHVITYTYNNGTCSNSVTEIFSVNSQLIVGLNQFYCANEQVSGILEPSSQIVNYLSGFGYTFTRLRFLYASVLYDFPLSRPNPVGEPNQYILNIQSVVNVFGAGNFDITAHFTNDGGITEPYINQTFRITPLGFPPEILADGTPITEKFIVCSNATPLTLASSNSDYSVNGFSITAGQASTISGNQFIPSNLNFGGQIEMPLSITMNYDDVNGCTTDVTKNFIGVNKPPAPLAPDVEYCQFANPPFPIFASGYGDNYFWYTTDPSGGTATIEDRGAIFSPSGITGQVPTQQTFYVTQVYSGCEGDPEPVILRIKPAPSATFTLPTICVDKEFTVSGPLDNSVNPAEPYTSYEWSFGDALATGQTASHTYTAVNPFKITLTITSAENCTNSSEQTVVPGFNPIPDFSFNQVCEGDNTQFLASSNITVADYEWDFGDGNSIARGPELSTVPPPDQGTYKEPRHNFGAGSDTYNVTVTAYTGSGCFDSKTKEVSILNYLTHTSNNPYTMGSVDGGKGFWSLEDVNGNSTWEFNIPTTTIISSTESAWVTNATGNYNPNERSFLNSPCLNISAVEKPVFSLDYISNTQSQFDGAVLEYSTDGGLTWESLGLVNSGLQWFNTNAFFTGNIGNSPVGWSGDIYTNDKSFVQGRRAIDNISGLTTPANRTKVRFRLAFASNNDGQFEGFAFKKVSIESRNRNLLVENFTQTTSITNVVTNNQVFNNLPETEAIKLEYHLGFPGPDQINSENKADPSARAAFYGITNNANPSLVPRAYIDGYSEGSFVSSWKGEPYMNYSDYMGLRSLSTAPMFLEITTEPMDNDSLVFIIHIDALQDIINTNNTNQKPVLHAVIIEKDVNGYKNVLRKLIPNAAGKALSLPILAIDQPLSYRYTWKPENPTIQKNQIAIIAFVQDEFSKEVYQATALLNPNQAHVPDPQLITGLEDPAFAEKVEVYPNPANEEVHVELPAPVAIATPIRLMNAQGRMVYEGSFASGEYRKTINTASFAGGMYILQIQTKETKVWRKVLVAHQGN